jgi:hypothetical protein
MRWGPTVVGLVVLLTGVVWFLQGIRILPGSFMTGSRFWAVTGAVLVLAGIAILWGPARRRPV